jgi:ElaB/YqjD/DUF883 family membrane-anchored ribosome-binding protein
MSFMSNEIQSQEWHGQNLGDEIERQVGEVELSPQGWQARAADNAKRALNGADSFVHEKPWPVIGAVAILSLAVGLLLARTR